MLKEVKMILNEIQKKKRKRKRKKKKNMLIRKQKLKTLCKLQ
jgi:hypothetical protein